MIMIVDSIDKQWSQSSRLYRPNKRCLTALYDSVGRASLCLNNSSSSSSNNRPAHHTSSSPRRPPTRSRILYEYPAARDAVVPPPPDPYSCRSVTSLPWSQSMKWNYCKIVSGRSSMSVWNNFISARGNLPGIISKLFQRLLAQLVNILQRVQRRWNNLVLVLHVPIDLLFPQNYCQTNNFMSRTNKNDTRNYYEVWHCTGMCPAVWEEIKDTGYGPW